MITLGPVVISDNMYLEGVEKANSVSVEQVRTVDGESYLTVVPSPGGRTLTLGTSQLNGATQGIWCQTVIDEIKALEATGNAQTLSYQGEVYVVVISSTSSITQMFQREPLGPNKKYTGVINLIEV